MASRKYTRGAMQVRRMTEEEFTNSGAAASNLDVFRDKQRVVSLLALHNIVALESMGASRRSGAEIPHPRKTARLPRKPGP